ncbi:MAG: T9SS type A sorting domain-containing protein [Bacteroidetes bacterium]|nr:T9SS type A sorting domain-containing protein [Bacteroidota bacterium]
MIMTLAMVKRGAKYLLLFIMFYSLPAKGQSNNIRGMYVNSTSSLLGDSSLENQILRYAVANDLNYMTLYDLNNISWTSTNIAKLAVFISKAKTQYRIVQVGASGETYNSFATRIMNYNNRVLPIERFNVFNFEFEFWLTSSINAFYSMLYLTPNGYTADTSGAFAFAWREFQKIDSLTSANGLISEIYLGWPNRGQMQQLASKADRILLHSYRTTDADIYQYTRNRLLDIASGGKVTTVLPIFSSEQSYMYNWLSTNPTTKPYVTYTGFLGVESDINIKNFIRTDGYTWFSYAAMPKPANQTATISPSGPTHFCNGGSVTLTANQGSSYFWTPGGQTTRSITVNSSGTFTVKVTDSTGVVALSRPMTIAVSASAVTPTITASGPTSFCAGGSVMLTSSPANSYLWSNGATTQSIVVTTSGNYSVTGINTGCSATSAAIVVSAMAAPVVPVITASGSLSICPGTLLTLTSTPGTSYAWSNGATTRSIIVSAAGSYTVRMYGSANCSAVSTPKVVSMLAAPAAPVITPNSSTTLTSSHTSVSLTSSTANQYRWSTNATTRSITVSTQGIYRVSITGTNGCTATSAPVAVIANGCTPPPVPVVTASGPTILNPGQTVTLTSTVSNGYLWSTGATTRSIVVNTSGVYTVRSYRAGFCFATSLPITVGVISARLSNHETESETETAEVKLYPNPARSFINIEYTSQFSETKNIPIVISDLSGRERISMTTDLDPGFNKISVELEQLSAGIYFCLVGSGGERRVFKFVVE